jgi:hypothetical protein
MKVTVLYAFIISPMRAVFPASLLLGLITVTVFVEAYKLEFVLFI